MKEYDVHFLITFSDHLSNIRAKSKTEAIERAKEWLNEVLEERLNYLISLGNGDGFETDFTDVLEIGKDI